MGVLLSLRRLRARRATRNALAVVLGVAAAPTLLAWAAEAIAGLPVSGVVRALAAAPLGLTVTVVVLSLLRPHRSSIG